MIPIIGIMIGLYVVTRMTELVGTSTKSHVRILASIALVGNVLGMILLFSRSTDQSAMGEAIGTGVPSPRPMALAPDSSPTVHGRTTTWEASQSTNPLDDSPIVTLMLTASSGAASNGDAPTLILRCKSKTTEAYIAWDAYLGSDATEVTTRLGKSSAERRSWGLSTDNSSTFYPGNPVAFVKGLLQVDTLVARTTPYAASPITAVFSVSGLAEHVGSLEKACGWH